MATKATSIELLPKDRFALLEFDFARFQSLLGQLASRGVPVVVNLWASWCGPCRVESPHLVEAARRHGTEVQFLGVDILDLRGPARAFIQEEGYPYPSVFNPRGDIRDGLGYIGQPVTIFYDATGRKVDEWSGASPSPAANSGIPTGTPMTVRMSVPPIMYKVNPVRTVSMRFHLLRPTRDGTGETAPV